MITSNSNSTPSVALPGCRLLGVLATLLTTLIPAARLAAQDATQDIERSFQFINQLADATDLFNAGKPGEALPIYRQLALSPELDEDGYAALGVGDCLAALGQNADARAAYTAALAAHPGVQSSVSSRLGELDVVEADDAAIARLRAAASSGSAVDLWRLGRALQRRAETLLQEAGKILREATASNTAELLPGYLSRTLAGHVAVIEELTQDLSELIAQAERSWSAPQRAAGLNPQVAEPAEVPAFSTQRQEAEFLLETQGGQRVKVQLRGDSDCDPLQVLVNGKPVELSATERQLLQRHRDRLNAILMEAANRAADPKSERR